MKVLIIEPCFVNFGGYFRSFPMSQSLSEKGVQVDLLVSSNKKFDLKIRKTKINENFWQYELPRARITPYLNGRLTRGLIALFFGMFGKYDIVLARVPAQLESNIPAFFLKLMGKNVVIDWDDYWMGTPIFEGHNFIKKYNRFCEMRAPKFFGNMVVISDFLGERAKKWGARNILKIVNGTASDQFKIKNREDSFKRLNLDKNKKYLLCIGNTYSRERTILLFEALEQIRKLDSEVKLICNFNMERKIKEQNLEGKINEDCLKNTIALGYINHSDLEDCFSVCSATILLQGITEDELACYPVRVASYLSAETVIIMNDTGSEAVHTLKKYGCAIIEKDISVLAEKTAAFLKDNDLQKEMKRQVILAKKDLSWNNMAIKLIEFFQEIIKVQ
ncbi:MAG: hypothetical protein C0412_10525 [Flavobacterium sp.]|nr:hypothetical protein [Flavobacterium sp.]